MMCGAPGWNGSYLLLAPESCLSALGQERLADVGMNCQSATRPNAA